jgi:hypothetical protein
MSKILKNQTLSPIPIADVGNIVIPVLPATYTIPPTQYLKWAQSNDILPFVSSPAPPATPDIIVNDGMEDLNRSDGVDLIKGIFNIHLDTDPRFTLIFTGDTTPPNTNQTIIDTLFTATELYKAYRVSVSCRAHGAFEVRKTPDGGSETVIDVGRTSPANPNAVIKFEPPEHFNPNDRIKVVYRHIGTGSARALDCTVGGVKETV